MTYPIPQKLILPINPYIVSGYHFRDRVRRKVILWATHLGEDVQAPAGKQVYAIGDGEVVWSEMRLGTVKRRNWGGLVVVAHKYKPQMSVDGRPVGEDASGQQPETFYSVYGHMKNLQVTTGDMVVGGQVIGVVAEGLTPENGWWKIPHLHFGIYVGPWRDSVLPGYKRFEEFRTKTKWWEEPSSFIEKYNQN